MELASVFNHWLDGIYFKLYPYIRYPSVHGVDIYILQEMRSPHSGLLACVLGWGACTGQIR